MTHVWVFHSMTGLELLASTAEPFPSYIGLWKTSFPWRQKLCEHFLFHMSCVFKTEDTGDTLKVWNIQAQQGGIQTPRRPYYPSQRCWLPTEVPRMCWKKHIVDVCAHLTVGTWYVTITQHLSLRTCSGLHARHEYKNKRLCPSPDPRSLLSSPVLSAPLHLPHSLSFFPEEKFWPIITLSSLQGSFTVDPDTRAWEPM